MKEPPVNTKLQPCVKLSLQVLQAEVPDTKEQGQSTSAVHCLSSLSRESRNIKKKMAVVFIFIYLFIDGCSFKPLHFGVVCF